jgi:hypothetical protein
VFSHNQATNYPDICGFPQSLEVISGNSAVKFTYSLYVFIFQCYMMQCNREMS